MSKLARTLRSLGLALGLLPTVLEGAPKPPPPPPTCPTCPIVYSQQSSDRADLMLMQVDGTLKTLLLAGARNVYHIKPIWAPDGEWIAFNSNSDGAYGIWLIQKDGSGLRKVAWPCAMFGWTSLAVWRPGTGPSYWLAYPDNCDGSSGQDIWAVRIDPGGEPNVAPAVCLTCEGNVSQDYWLYPGWTGDGRHFAALKWFENGSTGETDAEYVLFDFVDGGTPTIITPRAMDLSDSGMVDALSPLHGSWAHGRDSLIVRDAGALWLIDADHDVGPGENIVLSASNLTPASDYPNWSFGRPSWSPYDSHIVFSARIPQMGKDEVWGVYVAPLGEPGEPLQGLGAPIAKSNKNILAEYPDWNPVP